jgi:hypothetical protein
MAGDYTRYTFRPQADRAAVLLQQGRVQLDADWNELAELLDRRWRAETVDIIGRCGVPRTTIDGFKIAFSGTPGVIEIGPGRCYADGLLAENRGTGAIRYEPVWGEQVGTDWTPYEDQPYFRPAPSIPTIDGGGGINLVYLDVWNREVTAAEDPALVEPAVGVDTATRIQTVWAVRVIADVGADTCAEDWSKVEKWLAATRPSGARLSTGASGAAAPADPCLVQPTGGYRGVENRLYRVEIHDDGSVAGRPASFKWSRDNGAVAVEITSIATPGGAKPRIGVRRIGRDSILRFSPGDWVELLDDELEFAGAPGIIARIDVDGVDAQANELTIDGALGGTIDLARNPRVRRWDQTKTRNPELDEQTGLIPVGALPATFTLEDGVTVTFDDDGTGAGPHVADFWCFAARTTGVTDPDPFVEQLTDEPPRGIRHHYCRLALYVGDNLQDCRTLYPPAPPEVEGHDCSCDACVTPESHRSGELTIQAAIDDVGRRGGRVCLAIGVYALEQTVKIAAARSLTLTGKGRGTVLVHTGDGPAIDVDDSIEVTIEHLTVTGTASEPIDPAPGAAAAVELGIVVRNTMGATIQRCFLVQAAPFLGGEELGAVLRRRAVAAPAPLTGGIAIGLAGLLAETVIRENVVLADLGIGSLTPDRPLDPIDGLHRRELERSGLAGERSSGRQVFAALVDLPEHLVTHGLYIEDNLLACRRVGIDLGRAVEREGSSDDPKTAALVHIGDTRIRGNTIYGCVEAGIIAAGLVPGESESLRRTLGVTGPFSGASAAIFARSLGSLGPTGSVTWLSPLVLAGGSRFDVCGNILAVAGHGMGIGCDEARIEANDISHMGSEGPKRASGIVIVGGLRGGGVDHLQVVANRVRGMPGFGIASDRLLSSALVKLNVIDGVGIGGIALAAFDGSVGGEIAIEENQVLDVGLSAPDDDDGTPLAGEAFGIYALGIGRLSIASNQVARVGRDPKAERLSRNGIAAYACGHVRVHGNDVTGIGAEEEFTGFATGIRVEAGFDRLDLSANEVRLPSVGKGVSRALALVIGPGMGEKDWQFPDVRRGEGGQELAGVHGNLLEAAGRLMTAFVNTDGSCTFADNRCLALGEGDGPVVTILARKGSVIANANHVVRGNDAVAVTIDPALGAKGPLATVLGNMTSGPIFLDGTPLQPPWEDLNMLLN